VELKQKYNNVFNTRAIKAALNWKTPMDNESNTVVSQLRRNAVALISLVIAICSLSYNTWRNEKKEDTRNQRFAAY